MTEQSMFPGHVFTLWIVTIVLALVVFVPLSVYMLASLLRTARSIQHYARESWSRRRRLPPTRRRFRRSTAQSRWRQRCWQRRKAWRRSSTMATVLEARSGRA